MRLRRFTLMTLMLAACSMLARASDKFENYQEKIAGTLETIDMVAVPAGTLHVPQKEGPPREVAVERFWIGRTEVTWEQFDVYWLALDVPEDERAEVIAARTEPTKPYAEPSLGFGRVNQPAIFMTYHHASAYCDWLSTKTGRTYRLPTEVEWEYACRAGRAAVASSHKQLDEVAWHADSSATEEHPGGKPHPVARKKPNAWGLYDVLGNVWEWCTTADGKPVARGGSWDQQSHRVHPSARFTKLDAWAITDPREPKGKWWLSDGRSVGFRILREE